MKIITSITEMQSLAGSLRSEGKTIGFVPTMGFLHEGHLSLMRRAREENDIVVASIFVNPTQFGPAEDFDRYPRDAGGDRKKCESVGVDVLFLPEAPEMYPEGVSVFVTVEKLSDVLEGAIRPGHFRGVATVVAKLFNIVKPHRSYFGRKDYQQCAVIRAMVRGLNLAVEVIVLPTMRESDGLAMSSRNIYLDPEERRAASVLWRALQEAENLVRAGERSAGTIQQAMRRVLDQEQAVTVEYAEIADTETLAPLSSVRAGTVALLAVRLGRIRLIDNHPLL